MKQFARRISIMVRSKCENTQTHTHTHKRTQTHTMKEFTLSLQIFWSFQLEAARRGRVGTARVEVPGGMERHMAHSWRGQLGGEGKSKGVCVCTRACVSVRVCVWVCMCLIRGWWRSAYAS